MTHDAAPWTPADSRAKARIAYGQAAREVSDYARALVPTIGEDHMNPGEYIAQARHLALAAARVREMAVILEVLSGSSWEQIARALGPGRDAEQVREEYEGLAEEWLAAGAPMSDGNPDFPTGLIGVDAIAGALDAWVTRFADAHERRDLGRRPFSDGL